MERSTVRHLGVAGFVLAGVIDLIYSHLPVLGFMMIAIGLNHLRLWTLDG